MSFESFSVKDEGRDEDIKSPQNSEVLKITETMEDDIEAQEDVYQKIQFLLAVRLCGSDDYKIIGKWILKNSANFNIALDQVLDGHPDLLEEFERDPTAVVDLVQKDFFIVSSYR
ncbi:MAG: hypothetical protein HQ402_02635 [Parcubacteria group bacterium]|nr:hypothetical protein [Parcubacteria group bacterium]